MPEVASYRSDARVGRTGDQRMIMTAHPGLARIDLSIVIPVYRSEDCLEALILSIVEALSPLGRTYEVLLINDFSPDRSWEVIESICRVNPNVVGVDLRRNFGQDNAIMTGLRLASGDYVVIMDDDLQHHPKHIPTLLEKVEEGLDVVYADFRGKRQRVWKNFGSWVNGKIAEWVLYKPKEVYLSPYKIIRKDIAKLICQHSGPNPYVDGLILQMTSRITQVTVQHQARHAGRSNYSFWRSLGITARLAFSFSVKPLRLVTWFGIGEAILGVLSAIAVALYRIFFPDDFSPDSAGWASLMVTFLFISGIQMFFFGILGEYAGRTYLSLNNKPQTSIRKVMNREVYMEHGTDEVTPGSVRGG